MTEMFLYLLKLIYNLYFLRFDHKSHESSDMENRKRNRRKSSNRRKQGFQNLILDAEVHGDNGEEQEWYLGSPDVRLTKVFSVVLVLHIIAIGGILAFKMFDGRSKGQAIAKAASLPSQSVGEQRELAGKVGVVPIQPVKFELANPMDYQVIAGDTLSGIAAKLGVGMDALQLANNINAPDEIFEGMILQVPIPKLVYPAAVSNYDQLPDHPTEVLATQADYMKEAVVESGEVYEVRRGDTAWGIANKFGVDAKQLLRLNGIQHGKDLQAGRMLAIPTR